MAPQRWVATVMGLFWVVAGLSSKLAAEAGKIAVQYGALKMFTGVCVITAGFGILMMIVSKPLMQFAREK